MYIIKMIDTMGYHTTDSGYPCYLYKTTGVNCCPDYGYPEIGFYHGGTALEGLVYFPEKWMAFAYLARWSDWIDERKKYIVETRWPKDDEKYYVFDPAKFDLVKPSEYTQNEFCRKTIIRSQIEEVEALLHERENTDKKIKECSRRLRQSFYESPNTFKEMWEKCFVIMDLRDKDVGRELLKELWELTNKFDSRKHDVKKVGFIQRIFNHFRKHSDK